MVVYFVLLATYTYSIDRNGGLAGSIDFARGESNRGIQENKLPRLEINSVSHLDCWVHRLHHHAATSDDDD